ncbi:peptide deformylase [Naumannella cuiyingiana]|uniref:Peptide deformylase n=1 Tax=Naumannella cuiyingiana TaxID=1347891 RepID=A0A7Z0DAV8_9ACTN|nr:peptide deformylase [Naumannella cuiyingiana]NYI72209.1 peptide deformylase [Naumannella cuiyingiana]
MTSTDLTGGGRVRPITRWGAPVMHAPTTPVTKFDDELRELARDMFATMAAASGVGLAATQVGLGLSIFVYDCPDEDEVNRVGVLCNPVVELPTGKERHLETADEGCLSLPGAYAELARPDHAIARGQDEFGNDVEIVGTGLLARCLQHETDHLNGIVFGDRLRGKLRKGLYAAHEELSERYPADWPVHPARRPTPADAESDG